MSPCLPPLPEPVGRTSFPWPPPRGSECTLWMLTRRAGTRTTQREGIRTLCALESFDSLLARKYGFPCEPQQQEPSREPFAQGGHGLHDVHGLTSRLPCPHWMRGEPRIFPKRFRCPVLPRYPRVHVQRPVRRPLPSRVPGSLRKRCLRFLAGGSPWIARLPIHHRPSARPPCRLRHELGGVARPLASTGQRCDHGHGTQ